MSSPILLLYRRMTRWPLGGWLFARAVCWKAPYFATIAPRFLALDHGRCEVEISDCRRIHNHIGSVHAIALCNLAELAAGVMTDATIPSTMRWIPKSMSVDYLKKAMGTMRAVATPDIDLVDAADGHEVPVSVLVSDLAGEAVFRASITMWLSPRQRT